MKPDVLIVKHVAREGPGLLERVLTEHEITYDVVELDQGQSFPSPVDYRALVVLGGPGSANDVSENMRAELAQVRAAVQQGVPYLGICLGMHMLVKAAGGNVVSATQKEVGFVDAAGQPYVVTLTDAGKQDPLFAGLPQQFSAFQLHRETVELTPAMQLLATSPDCPNQAVKVGEHAYGIQSHFELTEPMLKLWADQEPDLQSLNMVQLMDTFARQRGTYTVTGLTLCRNFLGIAGLI